MELIMQRGSRLGNNNIDCPYCFCTCRMKMLERHMKVCIIREGDYDRQKSIIDIGLLYNEAFGWYEDLPIPIKYVQNEMRRIERNTGRFRQKLERKYPKKK